MNELVIQGEISSHILTLRGKQVMLDRDLAELYQVETKVLNQAVKRNSDRFPDDFMFQLSVSEFENWKSQFVTSNSDKMGLRRAPYAFTEEGIYMLATVLRSPVATQTSISIIRTFKKLREFSKHYNVFRRDIPCGYLQYMYKKNNHTINGNHKGLPLRTRELSMMGFIK